MLYLWLGVLPADGTSVTKIHSIWRRSVTVHFIRHDAAVSMMPLLYPVWRSAYFAMIFLEEPAKTSLDGHPLEIQVIKWVYWTNKTLNTIRTVTACCFIISWYWHVLLMVEYKRYSPWMWVCHLVVIWVSCVRPLSLSRAKVPHPEASVVCDFFYLSSCLCSLFFIV